jgi:hypothetical protein
MSKELKITLLTIGLVIAGMMVAFIAIEVIFTPSPQFLTASRTAESYEFPITEDSLIYGIERFKTKNPEFVVPKEVLVKVCTKGNESDERYDGSSFIHYHYFLIYFKQTNMVFCISTRHLPGNTGNESILDFCSIEEEPFFYGCWKRINLNLHWAENREVIKEFEENVLNKLGSKYIKRGNGLPFYYTWFN